MLARSIFYWGPINVIPLSGIDDEMEDKKSEDDYLGNIWGWKVSFLSLALILFMLALMGMRYCYLKQQGTYTHPTEVQTE